MFVYIEEREGLGTIRSSEEGEYVGEVEAEDVEEVEEGNEHCINYEK